MKEARYTVGEMANLCNVTAKQLRYYDQQGLLRPAHRDERNGYRYYDHSQIEEVLLLNNLRELELPKEKIAFLMKERDLHTLSRELKAHLYEVRRERDATVARYDALIDSILRLLGGIALVSGPPAQGEPAISLVDVPSSWVAYTRYRCYWKASRLFISRRAELLKIMDWAGLEPVDVNMAIFHSDYKKQFSNDPADYVGPYADMLPAYLALENYADCRGLRLQGTSMEEYLIGATMTANPQNYVTRLYLPLAEGPEK